MKIRLIILLLLLVPIPDLFYSCCPCDVTTAYIDYSHKALLLKNLDNSGEKTFVSESSQLNKNAYGIRLYLSREAIANISQNNCKQIKPMFIQSAYATSCICPPAYIYTASDSIMSIKIITLNDFDNQHLENSLVTECFKVAHSHLVVDDYVKNINFTYESDFEDMIEDEFIIDLVLMNAPTASNVQQFKVQIVLSDGRILEQETTKIELI